jgi:transposase
MRSVESALRRTPEDVGLSGTLWDSKTLSAYLERQFEVDLGVRQCQRLFRQLGFRLRKPRPMLASGDPIAQAAHKKNSRH